jgi:hypothetical protein
MIVFALDMASAAAQDATDETDVFTDEGVADWARAAFFHVTITGKLRSVGTPEDTREGKAFAVAPNLLVTAQHLVGAPEEWEPKQNPPDLDIDPAVIRAVRPVDRNVRIVRATGTGPDDDFANPMILPVSPYPVDTAAVSFPRLELPKFFRLSMCGIEAGQTYTALMTGAEKSAEPKSVDNPKAVELVAGGFDPAKYDALYYFDLKPEASLKGVDGHDGSPIFDSEGNVVAVVSAVIVEAGSRTRILGTPIQPIFPGASSLMALGPDIAGNADTNMKCSLFDTVKRIKSEVAAHAIWSVEVDPPGLGDKDAKIRISYENVEENPSVDSIEVTYNFWGKDQDDQEQIEKIREYNDPNKNKIKLLPNIDDSRPREFLTDEITRIGRELVLPHVKTARPVGFIDHVELKIVPTLSKQSGGRVLDKRPIVRDFLWSLTERKPKASQ